MKSKNTSLIQYPAYLDTNVLVDYLKQRGSNYQWVSQTLLYSRLNHKSILISYLSLIELWRVMIHRYLEADGLIDQDKNSKKPHSTNEFLKDKANDKSIISSYEKRITGLTKAITKIKNIKIIPHPNYNPSKPEKVIKQAIDNFKYNLAPMDNFHLAIAIKNGAKTFITRDSDFSNVPDNKPILIFDYS